MRVTVLDIETIQPNWDDPDTFAPITHHEPVVISWLCGYDGTGKFSVDNHETYAIGADSSRFQGINFNA